ncbi:hypothetical protein ASF58_18955 [Methylobacterium sp. Leaf125]|uniref:tyrosine-type recombinase/integrase n=1 Tax=Methylobacterium sp. Leaf125 TaxID=1736265 RepID=UPI0006FF00FD|nr:site-specific integrase [Methylobacterium sp. Leaf125]KQQ45657.1 hypothetical protein ASF58_18955 [Methylobacterium sp. Leaf125]
MDRETAPYTVKTIIFENGERCPAIAQASGMLAYDPNVYGMVVLRERGGSSSSNEAHLRAVIIALNWAARRGIDLRVRVQSLELLTPFEVADLRDTLRAVQRKPRSSKKGRAKPQKVVVAPGTLFNRCLMVRDYLSWFARAAIQRIRVDDPKILEARERLEWFEREMVANLPKPRSPDKEGLGKAARSLFLEVIRPDSDRNPFQRRHRHRNYALLLLYYETGMRRGEALKLKGEHLMLAGGQPRVRIIRDPDDRKDTRKIEPKVKTQPHDDEISSELARALHTWMVDHRTDADRYPGAKRTPYCFVSRRGTPLGVRTVNDMYDLLAEKVPELGTEVYPHILRHTSNDRFSEAAAELGLSDAEELQARNYKFGWKKGSKQGERYKNRHARESADRVVQRMQEKSVEGRNR